MNSVIIRKGATICLGQCYDLFATIFRDGYTFFAHQSKKHQMKFYSFLLYFEDLRSCYNCVALNGNVMTHLGI